MFDTSIRENPAKSRNLRKPVVLNLESFHTLDTTASEVNVGPDRKVSAGSLLSFDANNSTDQQTFAVIFGILGTEHSEMAS